ncbi:iron-containing alcohol dehydrogenase [Desulfoscipio gibsoniae]|uniref:Alcohol dehydrogenase, class IV n=1 Tax=Desulfoscipio gibsoniae DSM 7213 TaxID=767817 RepID=R4KHV3_9FIRM|nr:iron-containing alcohol dehydrogenase [Desulfoscipio gibsoniae]AGL00085.1 alcohol dehydrogenase, class IV [Desulfoscipio gibsoniae DSM 7213]
MNFNSHSFIIPGRVLFEQGGLAKLSGELKAKGLNKVLLASDRGLEAVGMVKRLEGLLSSGGVEYVTYLDIEANPSTETVDKGVQLYKENALEAIVCLGGGSPMDTAKAIAVLVTGGGKIQDYEGGHKVKGPVAPIIAIPTTAGTGSEVTPFAVITDKSKNYKLTVFSYAIIPELAILDPELITTLPPTVAAPTGLDALTHAVEAYISQAAYPFSDAMAEKAMELIGKYIRTFVANRANLEAASGMLLGSMFAGIAFSWARLGNVHAMAHPLGGFFNIPHGVANAVLLPVVLEYNALADHGKYAKIFNYIKDNKLINGFTPNVLVNEIRQLSNELGIPKNLTELGVSRETIHDMAIDAMKSGNIMVNPRQSTLADIEELYLRVL